jgi:mannose-6-phosphate isomerase
MSDLYPLRFHPVYKNYLWGGRRFETALGRELASDGIYAESWEVADHPEGESIVAAGPLAGKSLRELRESQGEELLGRHCPQGVFPLLLKYLDANQPLSLQVHPDDRCAAAMGLTDPGKTEAWYVVEATPGGCLWAGFSEPVDQDVVEQALREGDIERLLHRVEPRPGDCIFVPAGTVHAIGAGLLVAEIQQMSNNTFRLSDWGRLDANGNPRPLHIEQGVQAIDYTGGPIEPTTGRPTDRPHVTRLVACEQFVLDRWHVQGKERIEGENRCLILTVVGGKLAVEGDVMPPLRRGQTLLIPAAWGPIELESVGESAAELLVAGLP